MHTDDAHPAAPHTHPDDMHPDDAAALAGDFGPVVTFDLTTDPDDPARC